jgi:pyruvate formate lyase activating enzyme
MKIHGLAKLTLLDFPKRTACTVFTGGCNMRCPFCHNSLLVLDPENAENISEEEFFAFLSKRKGILDGVTVTGGEPTLNPDLPIFIQKIKDMGFLVKLDTNGLNPEMLKTLLYNNSVDYVAMDIKAGFSNYDKATGIKNIDINKIKESIELVKKFPEYEFRTTVVKGIHTPQDIVEIAEYFKGEEYFYLQQFVDSGMLIDDTTMPESKENMLFYKQILEKTIKNPIIRGI